jgi:hypothetical protein
MKQLTTFKPITIMKTTTEFKKKKLGIADGQPIYLSPPSWDCGWYWGFGYLGNKDCHYHIDGLTKIETYNHEKRVSEYQFVNLYDGIKKHFGDSFIVKKDSDIWTLTELFNTFYKLKDTAEVLGRGGSNYTTNPIAALIINKEEVKRINEVIMPAIFEEIYKILNKY